MFEIIKKTMSNNIFHALKSFLSMTSNAKRQCINKNTQIAFISEQIISVTHNTATRLTTFH